MRKEEGEMEWNGIIPRMKLVLKSSLMSVGQDFFVLISVIGESQRKRIP